MKIERAARTLLGASAFCLLLMATGCTSALTTNNSNGSTGTPPASAQARADWGMSMLAGGLVGVAQFPAKFTFDVNATPSCSNDFVVINTSLTGVAPSAAGSQTGSWSATLATGGTVTITSSEATLVLTASTTMNTGLNFQIITSNTVEATNLAAAINRNNFATLGSGHVKVMASSSLGTVTVTASKDGTTALQGIEGNSIALTSGINNARFTWAGPTLTGGVGTGNIVAFNNLYSTQGSVGGVCNQNGPLVYWSYNTGTGIAGTSVVISGDGTKVAFVEVSSGGAAILRILKWKAGEGAGTGYPHAVDQNISGAAWSTCMAINSCVASITFSGNPNDIRSAPFYDYNTDIIYVGDSGGNMHKFTGVFNGTPAEVTTSPWPIAVNAGQALTSPVYDGVSGNIYVGDASGRMSLIREVGSTVNSSPGCGAVPATTACLSPTNLSVGTGGAIVDAPIVDGTHQTVLAVNGTETTNNGTVLQASTALASAVSFNIGGNAAGSAMYSGAFDNTYFSTPASGHMYVCGKDHSNTDRPAVYQLSFNSSGVLTGVGATPLTGLVNANGEACSPVTEIANGASDWIFFSVGNHTRTGASDPIPATSACTASTGCVISINVAGGPAWPPASVANSAPTPANPTGSTSGIVVDNVSGSAQASSFYFSLTTTSTGTGPGLPSCNTTAGVGCAVKLTQSALN